MKFKAAICFEKIALTNTAAWALHDGPSVLVYPEGLCTAVEKRMTSNHH